MELLCKGAELVLLFLRVFLKKARIGIGILLLQWKMLELVLVFYWCAKVHNAQPCWSNINVTIFSTEIYSFIDKRKSSKSSQMEVSAFPFCFPTCSLPQSTCYNSAHYSKLFVHTNIFILEFRGGKPPLILVARFARTNVAEYVR